MEACYIFKRSFQSIVLSSFAVKQSQLTGHMDTLASLAADNGFEVKNRDMHVLVVAIGVSEADWPEQIFTGDRCHGDMINV